MPDPLGFALGYAPQAIALFVAAIFLDSLRYKFTNHPKTQEIFGRLDAWASAGGLPGLFGRTGLLSQYVIGAAELLAATLVLVGAFYPPYRGLAPVGAAIALAVMSGAIGFHLFTPLGIDPNRDGGGLFRAACAVWIVSAALLVLTAPHALPLAESIGL